MSEMGRRSEPRRRGRRRHAAAGGGAGLAVGAVALVAVVAAAAILGGPALAALSRGTHLPEVVTPIAEAPPTVPASTDSSTVMPPALTNPGPALPVDAGDGIKVGTYLGNETRRFYGIGPVPEKLHVIWKVRIGSGKTAGTATVKGATVWAGTGWTGQCTLVRDKGRLYVVSGGFDHGLRKIDAETGEVVWRYEFPDVIKGTNSIWVDPNEPVQADRLKVIAGSRRGFGLSMSAPLVTPVRAVSFATGRELWRVPVAHTASFSRDADASALIRDGIIYQALESAQFLKLDPSVLLSKGTWQTPKVLASTLLYEKGDAAKHRGNLVFEASPAAIGDTIYAAVGAGRVYGVRADDLSTVWQYYTGSDLDGTPCTTKTGKLLVTVDREHIKGRGGVLMLDPTKDPADAVVWYLPTENKNFATWTGGIIGSASVNDDYDPDNSRPALGAVSAIDGNLYLFSQEQTDGTAVAFDGKTVMPKPVVVAKRFLGASISTPIFCDDHLIVAGYDAKVHVYRIVYDAKDGSGVELLARNGRKVRVSLVETDTFRAGSFESTPVVWNGRVYIGSRDGFLYCLGR